MAQYGLTALPAAIKSLQPVTSSPRALDISALAPPSSALAQRIQAFAKSHLPTPTFNHSMRVYSYGVAIARECFPSWNVEPGSTLEETWFMVAMLHDIGTVEGVIEKTALSYEFWAGVRALKLLVDEGKQGSTAPQLQAESVAEAIFRHQDVQDNGKVSLVTLMSHLGTLLDNAGAEARFVNKETVEAVNAAWPRDDWSNCFRNTVEQEKSIKPWAMVSRIEGFEGMIMANNVTGDGKGN